MNMLKKVGPKDIIALTAIVLIIIMKFKGFNGSLDTALALILGYYFAHRLRGTDNGHTKQHKEPPPPTPDQET